MEMVRVRYSHNESAGGVPGIHASIERGSDVVGIFADCLALPAQL
jgi:hypothetical protein